jgi:ABC-2 type transport system permease protein
VLVADVDMITDQFFMFRERGMDPDSPANFQFDNVTFVLNVLDDLAGDDRFLELRKRRPLHRTLERFARRQEKARKETTKAREEAQQKFDDDVEDFGEKLKQGREEYKKELAEGNTDPQESRRLLGIKEQDDAEKLEQKTGQLMQERDRKIDEIEDDRARYERQDQDRFKLMAVLLPPILPLLLAVVVAFTRRAREREGVARSRLR